MTGAATECVFPLQLVSKAHSDRMSRITKCCIFSSSNHQQKPKITHSCTVLAPVFRVILALCAETRTIFRHNLMHLCCLETISENIVRFFFLLISLETWQVEISHERFFVSAGFQLCGLANEKKRRAAEFSYRSHLSSIIFISTSCCDEMKLFAYYVHIHVYIVFKFEVVANYGG